MAPFNPDDGSRRPPNVIIWIYYWIYGGRHITTKPQQQALKRYRKRLSQRGMARFEVLGRDSDRELIRSLARRLAGDDPDSAHIRATLCRTVSGEAPKKGRILDALRRSPLVGDDLKLNRQSIPVRKVDL